MTDEEIFARLDSIKDNYIKISGFDKDGKPPGRIFHYTGAKGFEGIIKSDCIWASNAVYLNDASEIQYGRQLAIDELERLCHAHRLAQSPSWYKDVDTWTADRKITTKYALIWEFFQLFQNALDTAHYVASFCLEDNLLSQWRTYGKNGGGFSLGFDVTSNVCNVSENVEFWCFPIIYDPSKQQRIISEFIEAVLDSLESSLPQIELLPDWRIRNPISEYHKETLVIGLTLIGLCFKDQGFSVEKEWRICTMGKEDDFEHVEFRAGNGLLIPYIEFKISEDYIKIQSVTCGPGPDSALSLSSANLFLKKLGTTHFKAKRSEIPVKP